MSNTNLAQTIKQQIMVRLQALQAAGTIASIYEIDASPNPLSMDDPSQGYPFAIVAMPKVSADFEDQATNLRTYRFDILFVVNPEELTDTAEGVEVLIDAVLDQFDNLTNLTLAGAATAAVLPAELEGGPVSSGDKTYLCFVVTLKCRALYSTQ